jgi:hypothetical protein
MNPKYVRLAEHTKQLIADGQQVVKLERPSRHGLSPYIQDNTALHGWLVQVDNFVRNAFGIDSAHFMHLNEVLKDKPAHSYEVEKIVGILIGALRDLEGGFLAGQEQLVAAVVFDSVLEQARDILAGGYKDPSAILCRVVVEDCLRRLCREEGLPDSGKASGLNDALRDKGRYNKPQWRSIQSWLDIGKSAAHGRFSDYDAASLNRMIEDVQRFMAQELGA